jgi:SAM-dependent methyltransferase
MLGDLYAESLAGRAPVEIEYGDGRRVGLPVGDWMAIRPGDAGLVARCAGPTLDIGSGPGRLTVALGERGIPALGVDVTPYAVWLTLAAGGMALRRDVFQRLPGTGRWQTVLLADGNVGIGGDPVSLLTRVGELLRPGGRALVEVAAPGVPGGRDRVRLRSVNTVGAWFPWSRVSLDDLPDLGAAGHLEVTGRWTDADRWFAVLTRAY